MIYWWTFVVAFVFTSAVIVYADATRHGIGRVPDRGGLFNMGAASWAVSVLLAWIVAFPSYWIRRPTMLEAAKTSPVEYKSRTAGLLGISIPGVVVVLLLAAAGFLDGQLPTCDSPEVVRTATEAIVNSPGVKALGVGVSGISSPGEISSTPDTRTCRAILTSSLGSEAVTYSVSWQDKTRGIFWVQIIGQ